MFADQHLDSQVMNLDDESIGRSKTGNSWNQDDIDYMYYKSDPKRYVNPYANRNPQEDGSDTIGNRLNQVSDDEMQTMTMSSQEDFRLSMPLD